MGSFRLSRIAVVGLALLAAGCDAPAGSGPSATDQGARDGGYPYAFGDNTNPCYQELFALYTASGSVTGTQATSKAGLQKIKDGLQTKANDAYYEMSTVPPKADGAQLKMTDYDSKLLSLYAGGKLSGDDVKMLRGITTDSPDPASLLGMAQACIAGFQS